MERSILLITLVFVLNLWYTIDEMKAIVTWVPKAPGVICTCLLHDTHMHRVLVLVFSRKSD